MDRESLRIVHAKTDVARAPRSPHRGHPAGRRARRFARPGSPPSLRTCQRRRVARPVGAPGLEPGASALSGPRSDHLSYAPPPPHPGHPHLGRSLGRSPPGRPSPVPRPAGRAGDRARAAVASPRPPEGPAIPEGDHRPGTSGLDASCVSSRHGAVRGRSGVRLAPLPAAAPWRPAAVARLPGRRPRLPTGPPGAGAHASPLTTTPLDLGCGPHVVPALPAARPSAPAGSRAGPRGDPP